MALEPGHSPQEKNGGTGPGRDISTVVTPAVGHPRHTDPASATKGRRPPCELRIVPRPPPHRRLRPAQTPQHGGIGIRAARGWCGGWRREGNGRAAKLILSQLAERSPYALDFDRISAEEWNQASERSSPRWRGWPPEPASLVPVFRGMTVDREPSAPTSSEHNPALQWAVEQAQKATQRPISTNLSSHHQADTSNGRLPQQERGAGAGYER